jgi:cellulose synthase/poly-beta-1,6-N-acetylglucosamine synthase-like glycosyltransferase
MILFIAFILLFIALIPYLVYLFGISLGRKSDFVCFPQEYPKISIIMSAYNEERVIEKRIANIVQCNYPKESFEIIFIDDCSSDGTFARAKTCLEKTGIPYQIISNRERLGTNRSYNHAIKLARYSIIVTTDADVFFEPDALNYLIGRLMSDQKIAAVTGELRPLMNNNNTTRLETAYRSYYGSMCDWESTIDSTYNFNGALVAFRSDLIRRIDDKRGSDDANTAFEAIRKGYKAIYEKRAIVYENIPASFKTQYRQKIRRATRLIEATLANLDLLGTGRLFSRYIYPFRIFMYLVTPSLFFLSVGILLIGLFLMNPFFLSALLCVVIVLGLTLKQNLFIAFFVNQIYLFMGLLNLGKDMRVWESTSQKPK